MAWQIRNYKLKLVQQAQRTVHKLLCRTTEIGGKKMKYIMEDDFGGYRDSSWNSFTKCWVLPWDLYMIWSRN